jgi:predicted dehydrogenase
MKRIILFMLAAIPLFSCVQNDGIIRTDVPERPAGQTDVIGLTAEPIDTVKVGIVGLGMRGYAAARRYTFVEGAKIVAVCDVEPDRVEKTTKMLAEKGVTSVKTYSGSEEVWKEMCRQEDIDLVYVTTDWTHHAPIGIYAMEQGKHVAIEVPAAMTLEEIWGLVNTSERTRKHCMQLENCVYDFFELTTLNMAQHGLFGEILHVEGAYIHDLGPFWWEYWRNWRLDYNRKNRGDVYPTHGIGPICQLLDIHRGDRMKTLVAMDTKAVSGPKYWKSYRNEECPDFENADHTMTMISTENGKTMLIEHDVMNPRPYTRMYQLTGTDGFANKYPVKQYSLRRQHENTDSDYQDLDAHKPLSKEVMEQLMQEYKHPIHKETEEMAKKVGGHGGMDYVMDTRLIYCLRNGLPLDMDVYDLAEWCCVIELSRISLENGSRPVEVPDFTRGNWNKVKGYRHAFAE